jgi:16S rRNA (cytosine967-C5)-methyltransferase
VFARWEVERARTPLDRVVEAESRSRRYLNSSERRWMSETVYGTVRFLERQRALLDALGLPDTPENLITLWGVAGANADGSARSVELPGWLVPDPFAAERVAQALASLPDADSPARLLRVTLSYPDDLAVELESLLGAEAVSAAEALNLRAPMTLRVNPLRTDLQHVLASIPGSRPTLWSPWGVALEGRVNLFDLPGFRDGAFEAQEEASQVTVLLTGAKPGMTVVDVGAGAGGKTLALAAMLENQGRIVALDVHMPRLNELQQRATRAGAQNVETLHLDLGTNGEWDPSKRGGRRLRSLTGMADVVFVDAPCTGTGALRRSPDAKWRTRDVAAFVRAQGGLLEQSAQLVKPGGLLVYVTCAFERNQNEAVVEGLLASGAGADFRPEPVGPLPARSDEANAAGFGELRGDPFLRTWPHRHGLDAFFAAYLRRSA